MKRWMLIGFAALLMVIPGAAQEATPVSLDNDIATVDRLGLPRGPEFGADWTIQSTSAVDVSGLARERVGVWYADEKGDRIHVVVDQYAPSLDAAIEINGRVEDRIEDLQGVLVQDEDSRSPDVLAGMALPFGCDAASRAEGREPVTGFPVGAVSCLILDDDRVLTIIVNGYVPREDGAGLAYLFAANYVLRVILDGPNERSTPMASQ